MTTKKINYTRGFLDCLFIISENINLISERVPIDKQLSEVTDLLALMNLAATEKHNTAVKDYFGITYKPSSIRKEEK